MTRGQIIQMAREAGIDPVTITLLTGRGHLERFAAAIRARAGEKT